MGFFSRLFTNLRGDPLNDMKAMSSSDPNLQEVTTRYESQWEKRLLTKLDVDCDMIKYKIRALNDIMTVLSDDLTLVLVESRNVVNRAIFTALNSSRFVSSEDYSQEQLGPEQQDLVVQFVLRLIGDDESTKLEDLVCSVRDMNKMTVGRVKDSCGSVLEHRALWYEAENERQKACPGSTSDPNNGVFPEQFNLLNYEYLVLFCDKFLNAPVPQPASSRASAGDEADAI